MRNRLTAALIFSLSILLTAIAVLSLQWRPILDSPIMLYQAFAIDRLGLVPYRDLFDVNMVGGYAVYLLVGHVFGYSDMGLMVANLFYLVAIMAVTVVGLRKLGWQVASLSSVLFGLVFLHFGVREVLQRDFLLVLPISAGVALAMTSPQINDFAKAFVIGLVFGYAAAIKPQAVIGFPAVMAYYVWNMQDLDARATRRLTAVVASILGIAVPLLGVAGYLWLAGGWSRFVDIVVNYLPLYAQMTREEQIYLGQSRLPYLVLETLNLGWNLLWVVPAVGGVALVLFGSDSNAERRQAVLLFGLTVCYGVYPALSGQFKDYQYIPFLYFAILTSSLVLVRLRAPATRKRNFAAACVSCVFAAAVITSVYPAPEFYAQISGRPLQAPQGGRVDEVAQYLTAHLQPGDTVQPLDWTWGAVHAMLIARARIATPFVHDMHFYRTVSDPYIQGLRNDFIADLEAARPSYIVQVIAESKPWLTGPGTTRTFPELTRLLDEQYVVTVRDDEYLIWEIK